MPEISPADIWFDPRQILPAAKNALMYPVTHPAQTAEFGLSMAPGSGEAMAGVDAWNASGRASNALLSGNYGQAASEYGNMGAALLGAIPGAGVIARGTARGAAWMDRNLPKGVNRLLDAAMPSDPQNTLNMGAGPTVPSGTIDKPIYIINDVGPSRQLSDVKDYMERAGAPDIRAVDMGDHYMALEGSHRLQAAKELGLMPNLTVIPRGDYISPSDYDWGSNPMLDYLHENGLTAGDIADMLREGSQNSFVDFRTPARK